MPLSAGSSFAVTARAAATCIAVGKLSFDDWLLLTWSLGWTGSLPPRLPVSISLARPAITSLAFMFDWVPDPVCQMTSGNWPSRSPRATSPAACWMASAICGVEQADPRVHPRRRLLDEAERVDDLDRHLLARAEREIADRALGLRAPIAVGRDLDRPEAVASRCGCSCHHFLRVKSHRRRRWTRHRRSRPPRRWARPRFGRRAVVLRHLMLLVAARARRWPGRSARIRPPDRGTG